jgi:hypothetical protein
VAWFSQMISSALVATVTGAYSQFGAHAMAALNMTADQAGVTLADDDRQAVATQLASSRPIPRCPARCGGCATSGSGWPR